MDMTTLRDREAQLRRELASIEKVKSLLDDPDTLNFMREFLNPAKAATVEPPASVLMSEPHPAITDSAGQAENV